MTIELQTPGSVPLDAFVYMVESPSVEDLYDGRTEARILTEAFQLAGIRSKYVLAAARAQFDRALGSDFASAVAEFGAVPILHLSAHGCTEGIWLTDGDLITWDHLRDLLLPANRALNSLLVVCMSSCYGSFGCRMAMRTGEPLPYFGIVGHPDEPSWSDAAVAYVAFYHRLFSGAGFCESLTAMRAASGDSRFDVQLGQDAQDGWTQFIRALSAQAVADELGNESAGAGDPAAI